MLELSCVGRSSCFLRGAGNIVAWGGSCCDSGKVLLEKVDESVGGGVVREDLFGVLQFRFNLLCQLFAQLHSSHARQEVEKTQKKH